MDIAYYFQEAIKRGASDLHLVEGRTPCLRISGELIKFDEEPIPYGELRYSLFRELEKETREKFQNDRDIDLSMEFFGNRFRVNLHFQEGKVGLAARLVPKNIPRPDDIEFDEILYRLTHLKDGLILVTGPSGTGKSTTLAVMLNIINEERRSHIITIEDPIEYTFGEKQSIVEQRQLGRDTKSFSQALKYALRQDPNIIMLGEMRDLETIQAALTAAKTGHLVLSTLHTTGAAETVERIVDYFPPQNHKQIAHQLATVLRAVIAQQLLPRKHGGLIVAREIMINNTAVSNLIRHGQYEQIQSALQMGAADGMTTLNRSIDRLLARGLITEQVAKNRKRDLETKSVYY